MIAKNKVDANVPSLFRSYLNSYNKTTISMKPILSLLAGLLFSCTLVAQKVAFQGLVTDAAGGALPGATVTLLTQDSIMRGFGASLSDGSFKIEARTAGDYLLQVSYIGYKTYWQPAKATAGQTQVSLGAIQLEPSSEVLPSVEIRGERSPMRMGGDTIEYNAAAFKVQPGDAVEDLLKKMPGIEVERDGTVKAHGETVKNVLVDGKEFFGNDTRVATQNLPAEAVDKVQVFDKKSDMAEFTGIDDGREERSINLKLKEGHKHGYFGKGDAGGGPEGRFEGRFNLNRFSPSSRLSAIGMANNTNQQGFAMNDYFQFMGGVGAMMSGGGNVEIGSGGSGIPLSMGAPQPGIRTSFAGGLNWSKDFSKNTELTASYFLNRFRQDLERNTTRRSLGEGGLFSGQDDEDQLSRNFGHNFNLHARHKIDSFQNIILRANGGFNTADYTSLGTTRTFIDPQNLENTGLRDYFSEGDNFNLQSSLLYRRRFRKQGRAMMLQGAFGLNNRNQDGNLFAVNEFFTTPAHIDTLRQRQDVLDAGANYALNVSYTEPLGNRRYLELSAARQNYTNENRREFFDILPVGESRNEALSNQFRRGYIYDRAAMNLMMNRKKYKITTGIALQQSRLENEVIGENIPFNTRFARLLPSFTGEYEFSKTNRMNLRYSTRFTEPSPEQLQPVVNNSDPLNIYIGNPELQPEYIHDLRAGYFLYDQFTFTSLFANVSGSYTQNKITNAASIDSLFRRSITPLNVDRETVLRGNVQFSTPIRPLQIKLRAQLNARLMQRILLVNSITNDVQDLTHGFDFALENRQKNKFDVLAGFRWEKTSTAWSVSDNLNQQFSNSTLYGELRYTPSKRWMLETKMDYSAYGADAFGEAVTIPLWQAGLTHYFLKNSRARVRLSVFDLLNKNQGISQRSSFNFVEQQRYNALGRYFLLSIGYSLSGFEKQPGIEIKMEG